MARAISWVENGAPGFESLLAALHPSLGRARRLGVTGPPGAGKSTLIERLAGAYRSAGCTVGVIAVDPSSRFTGGALLGDRIRLERVSLDPGVFIRSMASRGSVGGVATTTAEVADVMDAYGFDRILIETVGVGQSELDVAKVADTTIVVLVPESGDGIQVMKAGLMEIADLYVVNKADRPGADRLRQELELAMGIRRGQVYRHVGRHHGGQAVRRSGGQRVPQSPTAGPPGEDGSGGSGTAGPPWQPPVLLANALRGEGTAEVVSAVDAHGAFLDASGELASRRGRRLEDRTREVIERALRGWIWSGSGPRGELEGALREVAAGRRSPYQAAKEVIERLQGSVRV